MINKGEKLNVWWQANKWKSLILVSWKKLQKDSLADIKIKVLKLCDAMKPQDVGWRAQKNIVIASSLPFILC